MTEMIFLQGGIEYKLSCRLQVDSYSSYYFFKLDQREKGKRKWLPIKEQTNTYVVRTEMDAILKYLSKEQVWTVASIEYQKVSPSKILFKK